MCSSEAHWYQHNMFLLVHGSGHCFLFQILWCWSQRYENSSRMNLGEWCVFIYVCWCACVCVCCCGPSTSLDLASYGKNGIYAALWLMQLAGTDAGKHAPMCMVSILQKVTCPIVSPSSVLCTAVAIEIGVWWLSQTGPNLWRYCFIPFLVCVCIFMAGNVWIHFFIPANISFPVYFPWLYFFLFFYKWL